MPARKAAARPRTTGAGAAGNRKVGATKKPPSSASTAKKSRASTPKGRNTSTRRKPFDASIYKRGRKPKPPKQKRIAYRRFKVFRPWVIKLVFLVPVSIIVLERYIGSVISLDDIRETYYDQMGIQEWEIPLSADELLGPVAELNNLTYSRQMECPTNQQRIMTVHNPHLYGHNYRKVPNIVHQTSKTRCLTRHFSRATIQWAFRKYSYYMHDRDAVTRLVHSHFPEFPQLKILVENDCLPSPLLIGLWKYLVLWSYGGILVDLNTFPNHFNASTISDKDDGFFLLEESADALSTLVMAVSPRHPLMYYAVQHSISNILRMKSKVMYSPRELVGEGALMQALEDFTRGKVKHRLRIGKKNKKETLGEGKLEGQFGRSILIGGRIDANDHGIVSPVLITKNGKQAEYDKIGLEDLEKPIQGASCVGKMVRQKGFF